MRTFSILLVATLTTYASACLYPRAAEGEAYSYDGETGPIVWHKLDAKNIQCAKGKNQSPINVIPDKTVSLAGKLELKYPNISAEVDVINNGHTVQFTPKDTSKYTSTLNGKQYKLLQFHFHTPSEHRFNNEYFPLEVHFVHQDADSKLAVVGVFFEVTHSLGGDFLFSLNNGLNQVSEPHTEGTTFGVLFNSVKDIVRTSKAYTYAGSLTTPPCDEGVTWFVVQNTLSMSVSQFQRWKDIIKFNSRYTQNHPGKTNLIELAAAAL